MKDVLDLIKQTEHMRLSSERKHDKMSDTELRRIIDANNSWIQTMPVVSATYETNKEAAVKMAEMEYCIEILERRETKRKSDIALKNTLEKKKKKWKANELSRRDLAVLNLPVSVTYHGQLIAAILENEDYKSIEELASWNEELSSFDEVTLQNILKGLVNEGILMLDDQGKYSLLTICNDSLYPPNPLEWAIKKLSTNDPTGEKKQLSISRITKVIEIIQEEGGFASDKEIEEGFGFLPNEVNLLVDCGVLQTKILKHGYCTIGMYYFSMLGEKKGNDKK